MKKTPIIIVLVALFVTVGCDQVTKSMADTYLKHRAPLSFMGDTIRLQHTSNTGAFLGLGKDLSPNLRFWIFIVGSGTALTFMALYFITAAEGRWLDLLAGSLILGGGISNLLDRLANDGKVIDFLNLGVGGIRTGIFNLADVAILAGIVALLFLPSRRTTRRLRS
jgi:signal peptidase II